MLFWGGTKGLGIIIESYCGVVYTGYLPQKQTSFPQNNPSTDIRSKNFGFPQTKSSFFLPSILKMINLPPEKLK